MTDHNQHTIDRIQHIQSLAASCTALAFSMATKYGKKYGLQLELISDLCGIAQLAVVRAAHHYKADRGVKFTTYAGNCIQHAIWQAIDVYRKEGFTYAPRNLTIVRAAMHEDNGEGYPLRNLTDVLPDHRSNESSVEQADDIRSLWRGLWRLPKRWRKVLRLRFWEGKKLVEVAKAFGVTKERVRQIEINALERLREMADV